MRHYIKFHLYVSVLAGVLSGCAGNMSITEPGDTPVDCRLTDEIISRDGRQGLQMTNDCNLCMAVAFAYEDSSLNNEVKTACYVPSKTRVVYWQVNNYQILSHKRCEQARREGFAGIATAEQLQGSYQSGTCEIFGTFAD